MQFTFKNLKLINLDWEPFNSCLRGFLRKIKKIADKIWELYLLIKMQKKLFLENHAHDIFKLFDDWTIFFPHEWNEAQILVIN